MALGPVDRLAIVLKGMTKSVALNPLCYHNSHWAELQTYKLQWQTLSLLFSEGIWLDSLSSTSALILNLCNIDHYQLKDRCFSVAAWHHVVSYHCLAIIITTIIIIIIIIIIITIIIIILSRSHFAPEGGLGLTLWVSSRLSFS